MQNYYTAASIAEFIAALSATIFLFKYHKTKLIWLLPLLWYILLNELLCQYLLESTSIIYILYNVYSVLVPLVIMALVLTQVKQKKTKLLIQLMISVSIISNIIELLIFNPLQNLISYSFTLSSVLIIAALLSYFVEELKGNFITSPKKNLFLWVCFGFLIFHISYPVLIFAQKYLVTEDMQVMTALYKIHLVLICISYLTIAFGFYWGEKVVQKPN